MSSNDLEAGYGDGPSPSNEATNQDGSKLQKRISQKIFKINGAISTLQRIVSQLGTARDTTKLRQHMHDITEGTRELIKDTTLDLKNLGSQIDSSSYSQQRQKKLEHQKLTKDFQKVVEQFYSVQRLSAEKSREVVDYLSKSHNENEESAEDQPLLMESNQRAQVQGLDNEIEFNSNIIEEREEEIREIEQGITELNEVFRDLGTFVTEQQSLLDNIESNVSNIAANTQQASSELHVANRHQKKSRGLMCYIYLILMVVAIIIVLGITS